MEHAWKKKEEAVVVFSIVGCTKLQWRTGSVWDEALVLSGKLLFSQQGGYRVKPHL